MDATRNCRDFKTCYGSVNVYYNYLAASKLWDTIATMINFMSIKINPLLVVYGVGEIMILPIWKAFEIISESRDELFL